MPCISAADRRLRRIPFLNRAIKYGGQQDLADAADALAAGLAGFTFSLSRFHIEELPLSPW
jgi:hypothetical protein